MHRLLLDIGYGFVTAAILSLSAVAFTLEYAVSRVANLAHGEILTIGAYTAYLVQNSTHNVLLAAVSAAIAGGVAGYATNVLLIERFAGRAAVITLIASLGLSLVLQNILVMIFGAATKAYTITQGAPHSYGPFQFTHAELLVILSAVVIAVLLFLLLQQTKFGKAVRAVAENRDLARASGIHAKRVIAQTWLLAGVVAGFAGFVLAENVGAFSPSFGNGFLLITITATVAGGLGRPYGTLIGALLVGMALELAGAYTNSSYELAFAFAILVLLLLVRPNGLLVRGSRTVAA
ncbi:MAG TPA: branched-chain amino acid ABC transporter permease [Mycobacteriales bacterium]|jgi:branched-subunit amino acid ABC-type transport system permease component|nr:branched-chain amino acid ABC transporter permease [Mycobacteriales bacterium]